MNKIKEFVEKRLEQGLFLFEVKVFLAWFVVFGLYMWISEVSLEVGPYIISSVIFDVVYIAISLILFLMAIIAVWQSRTTLTLINKLGTMGVFFIIINLFILNTSMFIDIFNQYSKHRDISATEIKNALDHKSILIKNNCSLNGHEIKYNRWFEPIIVKKGLNFSEKLRSKGVVHISNDISKQRYLNRSSNYTCENGYEILTVYLFKDLML